MSTTTAETSSLEQRLVERIESGSLDLPMLPRAAGKVISIAEDPSADAAELTRLIEGDQALAGHVMRVSNSPVYRGREELCSLQQAIARLGMTMIAEIAFTVTMQGNFFDTPGHEKFVSKLWQHALASATWNKEVARARRNNVESAFLCGLLHQVGKSVLVQEITKVARDARLDPTDEEFMELVDRYFIDVGVQIATVWALPPAVVGAIRYFIDYEQAEEYQDEAMITLAGDLLATWLLESEDVEATDIRNHPVFADLNLYPADIDALLGERERVAALVQSMTL